jgi:hypothetical protein
MSYPQDQFDPSSMRQTLPDMAFTAKTDVKPLAYSLQASEDLRSGLAHLLKGLEVLRERLAPVLDLREQPEQPELAAMKPSPETSMFKNNPTNPHGPISRLDNTFADLLERVALLNAALSQLINKVQL